MITDPISILFDHVAITAGITVRVSVNYMPEQSRVEDGMLRLNVGLEDPLDLIDDLDRALGRVGL